MRTLIVCTLLLVGCSGGFEIEVGVPAASDFAEPVPVRVADVEVGTTGDTGLGPDNRPMVRIRIDGQYRDRVTDDASFVLRRERFGTGQLYVELIPGSGEPVEAGHHFEASSANLGDSARKWWSDMVDRTGDVQLRERLGDLRARLDEAVSSGRERWDEERPELEAEAREILERLQEESDEAAEDFRRWLDDAVERAERATGEGAEQ